MRSAAAMGARVATGNSWSFGVTKLSKGDLVKWPGGVWYLKWTLEWGNSMPESTSTGSDATKAKVASNINTALEKKAPDLPREIITMIRDGAWKVILQEIRIQWEKRWKDARVLMEEIGKDTIMGRITSVAEGAKKKYAEVYDTTRSGQRGKSHDVYHRAAMEAVQRYIQNEFVGKIDHDTQLHKDFEPSTRWIRGLAPKK